MDEQDITVNDAEVVIEADVDEGTTVPEEPEEDDPEEQETL